MPLRVMATSSFSTSYSPLFSVLMTTSKGNDLLSKTSGGGLPSMNSISMPFVPPTNGLVSILASLPFEHPAKINARENAAIIISFFMIRPPYDSELFVLCNYMGVHCYLKLTVAAERASGTGAAQKSRCLFLWNSCIHNRERY